MLDKQFLTVLIANALLTVICPSFYLITVRGSVSERYDVLKITLMRLLY